jgi:DNA modification methylase
MINYIHQGQVIEGLQQFPDKFFHTCVTSPPYYGLRDYGVDGQIGLEQTPEEFIQKLVEVFRVVRDKLRDDGTVWLNIGDSYAAGKTGRADQQDFYFRNHGYRSKCLDTEKTRKVPAGLKPKDLIGIPWMLAFALRADGWYLRQDIIWNKPNPMPESVTDRCTKAHEYIFLLSKSKQYYYDHESIKQEITEGTVLRYVNQDTESQKGSDRVPGKTNGPMKAVLSKSGNKQRKPASERGVPEGTGKNQAGSVPWEGLKANKRSVWTVATQPYKEAHFATFPEKLIIDCIKAGSPAGGNVLDPFMGAGTTAVVAKALGRNYGGCELNPEYMKIIDKRLRQEFGMFHQ